MIKTTVTGLFNIMRPFFRNFPNDYVVVDVETTGIRFYKGVGDFFPNADLITQVGWCVVKDSRAINQGSFMLNWLELPQIKRDDMAARLLHTKQMVEMRDGQPTGKKYHMTLERMESEGVNPLISLKTFKQDVIDSARENQMFLVAHNGYHFDVRMIEQHCNYWLNEKVNFGPNEIFDTGMVEKGSQSSSVPWIGDTVKDWSYRTYRIRLKNVRWALDKSCVARYRLDERHYLPKDIQGKIDQAHDAGFDSYLTHLLFEEYKEITAGRRPEPPIPYKEL